MRRAATSRCGLRDGKFAPAGLALVARIERADEDGLDPSDYKLPLTEVGPSLDLLQRQSLPGKDFELEPLASP